MAFLTGAQSGGRGGVGGDVDQEVNCAGRPWVQLEGLGTPDCRKTKKKIGVPSMHTRKMSETMARKKRSPPDAARPMSAGIVYITKTCAQVKPLTTAKNHCSVCS